MASGVCLAYYSLSRDGVWVMAYGVWRWRMAYGVWRMAHGVWRMAYARMAHGACYMDMSVSMCTMCHVHVTNQPRLPQSAPRDAVACACARAPRGAVPVQIVCRHVSA